MKIYTDPITGYEIRKYTDGPERNAKLYFTCENFSLDDQYFFFMKNSMQKELGGGCYKANVKTGELIQVTNDDYRGFATDREKNIGYTCKNETEVYAVDLSTMKMTKIGDLPKGGQITGHLTAADTGHMVFATIHTTNATETIQRVLSMYPPHQHDEIRLLLGEVLAGIISLRLLPTKDGKGRVPAAEILVNTAAIKEYIKDKDKLAMVESAIAEGHMQYHSQTFDQSLLELYNEDKISLDVALNAATNRDDFELKIRGITGTSERGWM